VGALGGTLTPTTSIGIQQQLALLATIWSLSAERPKLDFNPAMAAQLDFNPTARANVQGVACAALLAGVLHKAAEVWHKCYTTCGKGVRPLVDLGSH